MLKKAKIAVLVSGGGTNLQALIDAEKSGIIKSGEISLVISNKADAYALTRAEKAGINTAVVLKKECASKEDFEEIGKWISGTNKYFLQNFVDSGDLIGKRMRGCNEEEMKEFLATVQKYIPNAKLRGIG